MQLTVAIFDHIVIKFIFIILHWAYALWVTAMNITSECKTLWGEPERVHRISAVNIEDECTV